LLLHEKDAPLKELLKVTCMDLLLKQVLITKMISRESRARDKKWQIKYIIRGKNFLNYFAQQYENVFLSPYQQSRSIQIQLDQLIRIGFERSKNQQNYISLVLRSENIRPYLRKISSKKYSEVFR
jgi:hypothetical protein